MMMTKIKPVLDRTPKFIKSAPEDPLILKPSNSQDPPATKSHHPRPTPPTPRPKASSTTPVQNNLDRLLQRKPQHQKFLQSSTTNGRKTLTVPAHVQPKLDQDKENAPHAATAGEASAGKKAKRESPKSDKNNSWRKNVMPLPVQKRVGRLKRIDLEEHISTSKEEEKMPLAIRDCNRD